MSEFDQGGEQTSSSPALAINKWQWRIMPYPVERADIVENGTGPEGRDRTVARSLDHADAAQIALQHNTWPKLLAIVQTLVYFRAALEDREYEPGSLTVAALLEDAAAALKDAGAEPAYVLDLLRVKGQVGGAS